MNEKNQAKRVKFLTDSIKDNWKRSVESLIAIGGSLNELKKILCRDRFLIHIERHFSMSEMHSHRLINLYQKFGDKKSIHVLSSRPSVLYLLASQLETKKVESLAKGGKILVGSKYKTISQLTISDVHSIKEKKSPEKNAFDVSEKERDLERAKNAHRKFASFVEEISDWANDLERYQKSKIEIENKGLLKNYLEEVIECLERLRPFLL